MDRGEWRKLAREDLRARILAAARELFVASGYDAVSMRKIAQHIGYSPTTIYLHFKDKQSLVTELCSEDFLALAHDFRTISGQPDPLVRIQAIGLAFLEFGLKHPNHYRMMFMTAHPPVSPELRRIEPGNLEQDAWAMLVAALAEAQSSGRIPRSHGEPAELAQQCFTAIHGVISLHLAKGDDPWIAWMPVREAGVRMLETLTRGLTASGEGDRRPGPERIQPSRRKP